MRIAQEAENIFRERLPITRLAEQSSSFVFDDVTDSFRGGGDDRQAGGECFEDRDGHVIEPGSVDENVAAIIEAANHFSRNHAGELDSRKSEVPRKFRDFSFQRAIAEKAELSIGFLL